MTGSRKLSRMATMVMFPKTDHMNACCTDMPRTPIEKGMAPRTSSMGSIATPKVMRISRRELVMQIH